MIGLVPALPSSCPANSGGWRDGALVISGSEAWLSHVMIGNLDTELFPHLQGGDDNTSGTYIMQRFDKISCVKIPNAFQVFDFLLLSPTSQHVGALVS